jgi:hypothetical protein
MDARVWLTCVLNKKTITFHAPLEFGHRYPSVDPSSSSLPAIAAPPSVQLPSIPPAIVHLSCCKLYLHRFGIALAIPQTPASGCTFSGTNTLSPPNPKILCFHRICRGQPRRRWLRGAPWPGRRKKEVCLSFFIWRLQYSCILSYGYLLLWFGLHGGIFRKINSFCAMLL